MSNREAILMRLAELLGESEGVNYCVRNNTDVPESKLPAIVILDGDEVADERAFGRGRPPNGPNMITMSPEIHLMIKGSPETIGEELNEWLDFVIDAVQKDGTLLSLVHNREIRYEGCVTGFAAGRSMAAEAAINISFIYIR